MRSLIAILSLVLLAACNIGCQCGSGGMIVRSPVEFFSDPTVSTVSRSVVGAPVVHELRVVDNSAARCEPGARISGYRTTTAP